MKTLTYYITIFDRATKTVHNLVRTEETIEETIAKELGSWTSHSAMTSGVKQRQKEFFQAGTTRDDSKCFSILAIEIEE